MTAFPSYPKKREAMGKAAAAWIRETFTLDHMIEQVCDTYDEAIDARSWRGTRA